MSYTAMTIIMLISTIILLIIWDVFVFKKTHNIPGGDATISKILLTTARAYPIVAVIFGAAIGGLMAHLWWPQHIHICP